MSGNWFRSTCSAITLAALLSPTLLAQTAPDASLVALEEQAFRDAAAVVAPCVVQIRTVGGMDRVDQQLVAAGPTTGLIISEDGYILSSAFNFVQRPTSILVRLPGGELVPAELVATDRSRMLVLLKVDAPQPLPVPQLAAPDQVEVGHWVLALGRTFDGEHPNVSVGIISALNRMFGTVVQTDAAVSLANYGGPLVDLRGRVVGLIVPMSPQNTGELAGVEWYDSGIGFAVPLAELAPRIEQMKSGEDLHSGLLGIGLVDGSAHSSPAEIATVRPHSPAHQAGLRPGDRIIAIDGQPVESKTDLRFQLRPRYAGDQLTLTIARSDERFDTPVTLVGPLGAFDHAFLGVLPMRSQKTTDAASDDEPEGIVVRAVYETGPAAAAGISAGDRILEINGTKIDTIDTAIHTMNSLTVGDEVDVVAVVGGEQQSFTLTAARLPTTVPTELPPAWAAPAAGQEPHADRQPPNNEWVDVTFPEFANQCRLHVPISSGDDVPGLLIWLDPQAGDEVVSALDTWRALCDQHHLLLAVPSPAEGTTWATSELTYLRRLLKRLVRQYDVDPHRIVVHGRQQAGGMAYLLGLASRGEVRGISVAAAALPRGLKVPDAGPEVRLAIHSAQPEQFPLAASVQGGLRNLVAAGYPVTNVTIQDEQGDFDDDQRKALFRWIDTLDRF